MMLVLCSVSSDIFNFAVISSNRNVESDNSVASLDEGHHIIRDVGFGSSPIQEKLNLFEESGFLFRIVDRSKVFGMILV